jgi:hypothetical protein
MTDESATEKAPKKSKGGRPPGQEKTGGKGHLRPPPGLSSAQQRQWLRDRSGPVLENLLRKALGKRHKAEGPTGKPIWRETTPEMQERAEVQVINRVLANLSSVAIAGEKDAPAVRFDLGDTPGISRDRELARRLALVLTKADEKPHMARGEAEDSSDAPSRAGRAVNSSSPENKNPAAENNSGKNPGKPQDASQEPQESVLDLSGGFWTARGNERAPRAFCSRSR